MTLSSLQDEFAPAWRPFVEPASMALRRALAKLTRQCPALEVESNAILREFSERLHDELAAIALPTLAHRLKQLRSAGKLQGHTSQRRFQDYLDNELVRDQGRRLFQAYPVLLQLLEHAA